MTFFFHHIYRTACSIGSYKVLTRFLQVAFLTSCLSYIYSKLHILNNKIKFIYSMYNAVYFALRVLHGVHLLSAETQFFSSHSSHCILPFLSHSSLFFMSSCCNSASCTTYNIHNIHKTDPTKRHNTQHTIYTTLQKHTTYNIHNMIAKHSFDAQWDL